MAADDVRLVSSGPGDGAAVLALARESFAPYVERMGKRPAPMDVDYEPLAAAGRMLLAWSGTRLVGMLLTAMRPTALFLDTIAVAPEMQRTGLGARLMSAAEVRARSAGLARIELYTNALMSENLAYYPRLGYEEVGRRVDEGFDRVFFAKQLG